MKQKRYPEEQIGFALRQAESGIAFRYSAIGAYDFDAMLADRDFREAVFELREVQRVFLQWEEASLRRVREIQRMLGDEPLDEVRCL